MTSFLRMIFTAADCTALAGLWSYWFPDINPGVWVACTLGVVFFLNCLAVKYFGEVELNASIFKIFLIFGFLLFTFGVFNTAAFAIGGPDFIANCASEAVNPRRNIPKAVRRVIHRLIFFFILSVFAVGLLVPYNDPTMLTAIASGNGVAESPFIIAMNRLEISFRSDLSYSNYFAIFWVGIIILTNGYGKSRPDDL
ncbi:amino acid permease [Colletotrichum gloeosporioides Cg-14]|uniref:Amino acid permease n=1 Tax=Colletotrichum gloeosporioides (strain Cg-14) TaxID=1237896 RepID=T0JWN6_COLGC|nr:amino acid permease [Colletotrichum gloeosporioides Cg-14]